MTHHLKQCQLRSRLATDGIDTRDNRPCVPACKKVLTLLMDAIKILRGLNIESVSDSSHGLRNLLKIFF